MTNDQLLAKVAAKTGIPTHHIVGPFRGDELPVRAGIFTRVSKKTGDIVYAKYDGRSWGLYSDTVYGALRRAHKRSKKADLQWFGVVQTAT